MKSFSVVGGALVLLALAACARDPKQPGYEIKLLTDMVRPVPYEAFQKADAFAEGQTLLTPPKGTVPRGFEPFLYGKGVEEAERAGRELVNPVPVNEQTLARGKVAFEIFCMECHGATGQGDGPLIPKFPNPPSFTAKRLMDYPDGRIYHIISRGGSGGIMPGHATQIAADDRWKIINYVRSIQAAKTQEP